MSGLGARVEAGCEVSVSVSGYGGERLGELHHQGSARPWLREHGARASVSCVMKARSVCPWIRSAGLRAYALKVSR